MRVRSSIEVVALCVIVAATLFLGTADGYTCSSQTVLDAVATSAGEAVAISGCTFNAHVSIFNPSTVTINGATTTTFHDGLTIRGNKTMPITQPFVVENVAIPTTSLEVEQLVLQGGSLSVINSHFSSMRMTNCFFNESAKFEFFSSSVQYGYRVIGTEFSNAKMHVLNSELKARHPTNVNYKRGLYLQDCKFTNSAQLVAEKSLISSIAAEAVYLYSSTSTNYHMLSSGAVFNFTNATVTGGSKAISSTIASWGSSRKVVFSDTESKFVATDSKFTGDVVLNLANRATAEIDATSYLGIDLKITGDSEENIVIPVPHTVVVKRLALYTCSVHLPHLNGPSPTHDTWDVKVTHQFRVNNLRLANNQELLLEPGAGANAVPVSMTGVHVSGDSAVTIKNLPTIGFEFSGTITDSSVSIENSPDMMLSRFGADDGLQLSNATLSISNTPMQKIDLTKIVAANGSKVVVSKSSAKSFRLDRVTGDASSEWSAQHLSISTDGVYCVDSNFDGTPFEFLNSTLTSTQVDGASPYRHAIYLQDCIFNNGASLTLTNSKLHAMHDTVMMHAASNRTITTYHQRLFQKNSVMNFTNTSVVSTHHLSIQSYTRKTNSYHYCYLGLGSRLMATESEFVGKLNLFLTEGATAELDAASYENIDLAITGDSETDIVIPIPHTINVKSIALSTCRVHLPHLNVPTPIKDTWDVTVTHQFKVNDVRLKRQSIVLRPGTNMAPSGVLFSISNVDFIDGSSLWVEKMTLADTYVGGNIDNSVVSFGNVTFTGVVEFRKVEATNAVMGLSNCSVVSRVGIYYSVFRSGSAFHVVDSSVGDQFIVYDNRFHPSTSLSLRSTSMYGKSASKPALFVESSFFNSATLCISGCEIIGWHAGVGAQFAATSNNYEHLFFNGSTILFANTVVGLLSTNNYAMNNMVHANNEYWGIIGGTGDRGSNGTTLAIFNSTFRSGKCKLFLEGNGTNVIIDSTSLATSEFEFSTSITDVDAKTGLDAVTFYLPAQFKTNRLNIKGGTIRWMPQEAEALLADIGSSLDTTALPNITSNDLMAPRLLDVTVVKGLQWAEPLNFELRDGQQMVVVAAPEQNLALLTLYPSTVDNSSSIIIRDFTYLNTITVGGSYTNKSSLHIENLSSYAQLILTRGSMTDGSSLVVKDVTTPQYFMISHWKCLNDCLMIAENLTTKEYGVRLSHATWSAGSQLQLLSSAMNSTKSTTASLHLEALTLEGAGSMLLVKDSVIDATHLAHAVWWSGAGTLRDQATIAFQNIYMEAPLTRNTFHIDESPYGGVSSSWTLSKVFLGGSASGGIEAAIDNGGSLVFGDEVSGFVSMTATGEPNATLSCVAASATICTSAHRPSPTITLGTDASATSASQASNTLITTSASKVAQTIAATGVAVVEGRIAKMVEYQNDVAEVFATAHCPLSPLAQGMAGYVPPTQPTAEPSSVPSDAPTSTGDGMSTAPTTTNSSATDDPNATGATSTDNPTSTGDNSNATATPTPNTHDPNNSTSDATGTGSPLTSGSSSQTTAAATSDSTSAVPSATDSPATNVTTSDTPSPDGSGNVTSSPTDVTLTTDGTANQTTSDGGNQTTDGPTSTTGVVEPTTTTQLPTTPSTPEPTNATETPEPTNATEVIEASAPVKATMATTTATGTVIGAAASTAGGAAAADMQTALVIGFMSCAADTLKSVSEASRRTLYPLGKWLGDFEGTLLLGNIVFAVSLCAIHSIAVPIYAKVKDRRPRKAAAKVHFPSGSLLVTNLLYQGIALDACIIMFRDTSNDPRSPGALVLAIFAFLGCLAMPVFYAVWCRKNIMDFRFYVYDHARRNKILATFVYPSGRWDDKNIRLKMFRNVCGMLNEKRLWLFACALHVRSLLVAIIAAMPQLPCNAQAILLFIVFFTHGILLVYFRPLRMRAANVFSPLASFLSGLIALTLLANNETMAKMSEYTLLVATIITIIAAFIQVSAMIVEKMWKRNKTQRWKFGKGPPKRENDDDSGSDHSDDDRRGYGDVKLSDLEDVNEFGMLSVPLVELKSKKDGDGEDSDDDILGIGSPNPAPQTGAGPVVKPESPLARKAGGDVEAEKGPLARPRNSTMVMRQSDGTNPLGVAINIDDDDDDFFGSPTTGGKSAGGLVAVSTNRDGSELPNDSFFSASTTSASPMQGSSKGKSPSVGGASAGAAVDDDLL